MRLYDVILEVVSENPACSNDTMMRHRLVDALTRELSGQGKHRWVARIEPEPKTKKSLFRFRREV